VLADLKKKNAISLAYLKVPQDGGGAEEAETQEAGTQEVETMDPGY
jgi:hypothetical protein